jgi:hypothetical protein
VDQDVQIISAQAVFDLMFQRIYGNLAGCKTLPRNLESPEYKEVFEALPGAVLDDLRTGATRAFSPDTESLEFRGVFTGHDADGQIRPVYFRLMDLRGVFARTLEEVSPKSIETLLGDFDAAASTVHRKQPLLPIESYHILRGYGRGAAPKIVADDTQPQQMRRSYKPEMV